MTWETFYLSMFVFGLLMTCLSLVASHAHLPVHLPHDAHFTHAGPFNLTTIVIFLTWFGATGFLVTHYHSGTAGIALLLAIVVGLAGAALIYVSVIRTFLQNEHPLREGDFEMVGTLGRISSPVRENGGTGELIYSQNGTRRSCGARSEEGARLERGTEVVVMRYEKGIAWVRPWHELES
jgi:membrane protein implicated in regulation of membrane protease activity